MNQDDEERSVLPEEIMDIVWMTLKLAGWSTNKLDWEFAKNWSNPDAPLIIRVHGEIKYEGK